MDLSIKKQGGYTIFFFVFMLFHLLIVFNLAMKYGKKTPKLPTDQRDTAG